MERQIDQFQLKKSLSQAGQYYLVQTDNPEITTPSVHAGNLVAESPLASTIFHASAEWSAPGLSCQGQAGKPTKRELLQQIYVAFEM